MFKQPFQIIYILLVIFLPACSSGTDQITTPSVEPPPLQIAGMDDVSVHEVCLVVDQSYPNIEEEFSQPIANTTSNILNRAGIETMEEEDTCEATLTVTFSGHALGANYSIAGIPSLTDYYYTGAAIGGEITLAIVGQRAVTVPVRADYQPPISIQVVGFPANDPTSAPFQKVWSEALVDGLAGLWGPEILIQYINYRCSGCSGQEASARALGKIGAEEGVVDALSEALKNGKDWLRVASANALGDIGPEEGVVPILIQALEDRRPAVRSGAAESLGIIGPDATEAVAELIRLLADDDVEVQQAAHEAMEQIEANLIPLFIQAMSHEDEAVAEAVAKKLGYLGSEAVIAVPALIEAMDAESWGLQRTAAEALAQIGPVEVVIPALIEAMGDTSAAAEALSDIGAQSVPALIEVLVEDEDPRVRAIAVRALGRIGLEQGVELALRASLSDEDVGVRQNAASVFISLVGTDPITIQVLIDALDDEDFRLSAIFTLTEVGPDAEKAIPALILALDDENIYIRSKAAKALSAISDQDFGEDIAAWKQWWDEQQK